MSFTALLIQGLGFFCFVYFLLYVTRKGKRPNNKLPPGPVGFPVLGNLLQLGELPHRELYRLSKKHGPIMYMRFGFVPTIVVSSPQAAEQFLKAHDLVFANRPATEAGKYMSYERKNLSFSEYGPYWRKIRKLCTLQLFSNKKIDCSKSMRKEEVGLLVGSIRESAKAQTVVDLSAKLVSLTTNITSLMVFGRKYVDEDLDERGFDGVMREGMKLAAVFNLADYIPYVGVFDLQGLTRRMKAFSKVFDGFFEKVIDEHVRTWDKDHPRDFVDVLLSFMESNDAELQIDRTNIKAIILDLLAAGMDTTATTVDWALSDLLKHPEAMKKAQEELESVVGLDRIVEESDLPNLHYLEMVLKESMRLHPAVPLLLPHESMEDCTINGYHIPKKSRVIINAWTIGKDPNVWPNPEKFFPERFVGSNIDIRGHDFQLLPFGSGRRGCPGLPLGWAIVRLVLAQLLHCFNWELPNGMSPHDLDMTEKFSLVMRRANHLLVFPTYRLNSDNL